MFKFPKNDANYHWTNHVMGKMAFYGLSPERIKRIIRNPERSEKGIAPDTIAVMQPNKILSSLRGKPSSWKEEIWTMYALRQAQGKPKLTKPRVQSAKFPGLASARPRAGKASRFYRGLAIAAQSEQNQTQNITSRKIIITAWRYPGKSPVREAVPIPAEILAELREGGIIE